MTEKDSAMDHTKPFIPTPSQQAALDEANREHDRVTAQIEARMGNLRSERPGRPRTMSEADRDAQLRVRQKIYTVPPTGPVPVRPPIPDAAVFVQGYHRIEVFGKYYDICLQCARLTLADGTAVFCGSYGGRPLADRRRTIPVGAFPVRGPNAPAPVWADVVHRQRIESPGRQITPLALVEPWTTPRGGTMGDQVREEAEDQELRREQPIGIPDQPAPDIYRTPKLPAIIPPFPVRP